ncbi:hypothetical protein [Treponema phagedenis]|nr:hypothetical protein [Treponema phagedenis]
MRMSDVSIDNLSVKERLKEALLRFDIRAPLKTYFLVYLFIILVAFL